MFIGLSAFAIAPSSFADSCADTIPVVRTHLTGSSTNISLECQNAVNIRRLSYSGVSTQQIYDYLGPCSEAQLNATSSDTWQLVQTQPNVGQWKIYRNGVQENLATIQMQVRSECPLGYRLNLSTFETCHQEYPEGKICPSGSLMNPPDITPQAPVSRENEPNDGQCPAGGLGPLSNGTNRALERDYVGAGAVPLNLSRTFSTSRASLTPNPGGTWRTEYDRALISDELPPSIPLTKATLTRDDGTEILFQKVNGTWTSPTPGAGILTRAEDASGATLKWTFRTPDDEVEEYDPSGKLVAIVDQRGNRIAVSYGPSGVSSITNSLGQSISFTYSSGRRTAATLPSGAQIQRLRAPRVTCSRRAASSVDPIGT